MVDSEQAGPGQRMFEHLTVLEPDFARQVKNPFWFAFNAISPIGPAS
jgi:hypothetical protein